MRILVTAGNTQAPIDRVRCLTNIFTGRTGASIALSALDRGHEVTLLTSRPEAIRELRARHQPAAHWSLQAYRTFDDLQNLMADHIGGGGFAAVVHCAAVSDYSPAGVFRPAPHTRFGPDNQWESTTADLPALENRASDKIKSDEPELWLRLVRAPKLIDQIRSVWGFRGVLVKFKLELGVSDERLQEIAERSRRHSEADLMVANTLEGHNSWVFLGPIHDRYERIERSELGQRLLDEVERVHRERRDG
jgi:phosphopantothenate-cysteine ligase/phosphopantothenoylcysteine decarboxylase/phosphopantothenate--cysteine ligase